MKTVIYDAVMLDQSWMIHIKVDRPHITGW